MDISFTVFHTTIFFWVYTNLSSTSETFMLIFEFEICVRDIYSVTFHNINLKSRDTLCQN